MTRDYLWHLRELSYMPLTPSFTTTLKNIQKWDFKVAIMDGRNGVLKKWSNFVTPTRKTIEIMWSIWIIHMVISYNTCGSFDQERWSLWAAFLPDKGAVVALLEILATPFKEL